MKERSFRKLIKLYLSFHLNKMTLLLFLIIFILWIAVLLLHSGIPLPRISYYNFAKEYHQNYFSQSLFFMQLLNGAILAFLIGAELNSFSLFDAMFVVNTSRNKIALAKLSSNLIILALLITLESLMMFVLAIFIYPSYIPRLQALLIIPFQMTSLFEFLLLGEAIASIFKSYFIPILIFIIQLTVLILIQQKNKYISQYIPTIGLSDGIPTLTGNAIIYCLLCIVLLIGNFLLFQKKDIAN